MMAGPTTQASTPIGTVTDAQMARIFVKEYCLVSAASSTRGRGGSVVVLSFRCAGGGVCASPLGPRPRPRCPPRGGGAVPPGGGRGSPPRLLRTQLSDSRPDADNSAAD